MDVHDLVYKNAKTRTLVLQLYFGNGIIMTIQTTGETNDQH